MKTILISVLLFLGALSVVHAQDKFFTRSGQVHFSASTPLENIEADNDKGTSVLVAATGQVEYAVLMKAFIFEKALMQDHFNENYVESTKFPKAVFKGNITNIADVDFNKDGTYAIKLSGKLTLHGVTRDITANGNMIVKNGTPSAKVSFEVAVADYEIEIPTLVKDKVARTVKIDVSASYEAMKL
jgi:YceI-like domain